MGLLVRFSTGFLVGLYRTNVGEIDDGIMVGIDGADVRITDGEDVKTVVGLNEGPVVEVNDGILVWSILVGKGLVSQVGNIDGEKDRVIGTSDEGEMVGSAVGLIRLMGLVALTL